MKSITQRNITDWFLIGDIIQFKAVREYVSIIHGLRINNPINVSREIIRA